MAPATMVSALVDGEHYWRSMICAADVVALDGVPTEIRVPAMTKDVLMLILLFICGWAAGFVCAFRLFA
jgi:hypothetical protein